MLIRHRTIRFVLLVGLAFAVVPVLAGFIGAPMPPTEPALLPSERSSRQEPHTSSWYFNTHSARQRTQYLGQPNAGTVPQVGLESEQLDSWSTSLSPQPESQDSTPTRSD